MHILYYNDHIKEELEDACEYFDKAICLKAEHPSWASTYAKMGEAEMVHASNILQIFEEDYTSSKTSDPIYPELRECILKMYSEYLDKAKRKQSNYQTK